MKKTILLILVVATVGFLLFFLRVQTPFLAIAGKSMEPNLKVGDFVLVANVTPPEIKEGDIIVFELPGIVREHYNYPLVVAHRVLEIHQRGEEIVFRTKGDNTGEDPFVVRPVDLRGKVNYNIPLPGQAALYSETIKIPTPLDGDIRIPYHYGYRIPYLGYSLFFLQSKHGLITISIALFIWAIGIYHQEIQAAKRKISTAVFSPVLQGQKEIREAQIEYARNLKSHTAAIQSLAKAAEKLEEVVERLNKTLNTNG